MTTNITIHVDGLLCPVCASSIDHSNDLPGWEPTDQRVVVEPGRRCDCCGTTGNVAEYSTVFAVTR